MTASATQNGKPQIVAQYDYCDESRNRLFQVVRFEPGFEGEPKTFRPRHQNGNGWEWGLGKSRLVLYRLPELVESLPEQIVFIPEGEKDVDNLTAAGCVATTNSGGARKWRANYSEFLRDRHCVILPDNDSAGREHADAVAKALAGIAASVTILELPGLPPKGDVSDWLQISGNDKTALLKLAYQAAKHSPAAIAESDPRATSDELTDDWNARRFVEEHGQDIRFCYPWHKWLVWDGRRWAEDNSGEVERRAKLTARGIGIDAAKVPDERRAKALLHHAIKSQNVNRIRAMVELAKSEPGIPVLPADLDQNGFLLNVLNGTIDLRTGELLEHNREYRITKLAPVSFDPLARCPIWEEFLADIFSGNSGLIGYIRRFFGYCLTGSTSEQILAIFWGSGANGKSTLVNTIMQMLGEDYAIKASRDLFMVRKNDSHPTQLARLFGRRVVVCVETQQNARLDEGLVKELTGGDPIAARRMREDVWQFQPMHKAVLVTNHKPEIRGTDEGIWRRQRLIPFTVRIPDERQDKALSEKLVAELPGILAWCVQGCLVWQRDGLGEPQEVRAATLEYRDEQDVFGGFFEECCLLGSEYRCKASALREAYGRWSGEAGEVSTQKFGLALSEYASLKGHTLERFKNNGVWYRGIALRNTDGTTEQYGTESEYERVSCPP